MQRTMSVVASLAAWMGHPCQSAPHASVWKTSCRSSLSFQWRGWRIGQCILCLTQPGHTPNPALGRTSDPVLIRLSLCSGFGASRSMPPSLDVNFLRHLRCQHEHVFFAVPIQPVLQPLPACLHDPYVSGRPVSISKALLDLFLHNWLMRLASTLAAIKTQGAHSRQEKLCMDVCCRSSTEILK